MFHVVALLTASLPLFAEQNEAIKHRVADFSAQNREVKVTLHDRSVLKGRIVRIEENAFAIHEKKSKRESSIEYARVKEVKRNGLSTRTKAILIPAVAGGGAILFFCAAPYPIGFLCRKDPS